MITPPTFTQTHSSFWKECFPALESYIRVVNSGAYERVFDEIEITIEPSRSYIVSEVAFCIAKNKGSGKNIENIIEEAKSRLASIPRVEIDDAPMNISETKFAERLADRLDFMIQHIGPLTTPVFDPVFKGCGALAQSHGDVLVKETLIEVKSVDRAFRATDYRQLLTYAFLDYASGSSQIKQIAALNPRKGIFHKASLEQLVFDTSASSMMDVQNKFLAAIGFGGVSR